jgi:putative addiction module killer protein
MGYILNMIEIRETSTFIDFVEDLRDDRARAKISARIERLAVGNAGDVVPVGEGISEMRIHYGPGYRVYFIRRGERVIVLLCGGDKSTQEKDIKAAKLLAKNLEN